MSSSSLNSVALSASGLDEKEEGRRGELERRARRGLRRPVKSEGKNERERDEGGKELLTLKRPAPLARSPGANDILGRWVRWEGGWVVEGESWGRLWWLEGRREGWTRNGRK